MDDLKTIGMSMAEQDNRGTQYPLFVIQVDYKDYALEGGDWDEKERKDHDLINERDLCGKCAKLWEKSELPEECWEWGCEESFDYFTVKTKFDLEAGVFFTEEACHQHIEENKHHYDNPTSYVVSAWRNPEMVAVMQTIIKSAQREVPSHYK